MDVMRCIYSKIQYCTQFSFVYNVPIDTIKKNVIDIDNINFFTTENI